MAELHSRPDGTGDGSRDAAHDIAAVEAFKADVTATLDRLSAPGATTSDVGATLVDLLGRAHALAADLIGRAQAEAARIRGAAAAEGERLVAGSAVAAEQTYALTRRALQAEFDLYAAEPTTERAASTPPPVPSPVEDQR